MERRTFLRVAGLAATAGAGGCLDGSARAGASHDVGMTTRRFRPTEITVEPGETVVWRNTSSHAHTVTAYADGIPDRAAYWASGEFPSEPAARDAWADGFGGALYQDDVYERTFEVPGTHRYFCVPHERGGMVGSVVVTDGGSAANPE